MLEKSLKALVFCKCHPVTVNIFPEREARSRLRRLLASLSKLSQSYAILSMETTILYLLLLKGNDPR